MTLRRLAGKLARRAGFEPSPFVRRLETNTTRHANSLARRMGYDLRRFALGCDLRNDLVRLCPNATMIFDVGANVGQSIEAYKLLFPDALIHSFEPEPSACSAAVKVAAAYRGVEVNNLAVGSDCGVATFSVYSHSDMNSFLTPGERNWASVASTVEVRVTTIDQYCVDRNIDRIDILKTDTQGFDLEVLRGAASMLGTQRIGLVVSEVNFCDLYKNQAVPADLLSLMQGFGYEVVSFYNLRHRRDRLGWLDVLWGRPTI